MICPNCHTENIQGADECINCGASLWGVTHPDATQGPAFINQPIATLRLRSIARVGVSDPVGLAVRHMQTEDINCVLVMEGDHTAGILTGWDILQKVAGPNEDLNAVTCGQVMSRSLTMLRDEDTIALALHTMATGGFRHLPVMQEETPHGFIIASDLFRHISPHLV